MSAHYCWSWNGEEFEGSAADRDDAIEQAVDYDGAFDEEGFARTTVYTGRAVPWEPRIDGADVIDRLTEAAYEALPEHADDWLSTVTKAEQAELGDALTAAFDAWAEKYRHAPTFYAVAEVQEHALPTPTTEPSE